MRGQDLHQQEMFLYSSLEDLVPADHPLRPIRAMVDEALRRLDDTFDEIYGEVGRPSVAPERLLRALLLMLLYTIRSERMLVEQLRYNLLFRWFVGLGMNEEVWHATVFTKNRDRLLEGNVAQEFFAEIVRQAKQRGLMSSEHFSVDGTMVEAWASQKSFRPKREGSDEDELKGGGRNREVDFRGQRRRNETHESVTDGEARLWRKSQTAEAKLSYLGHALTENRHGLIVNVRVTKAHGRAEREAAVEMAREIPGGTKRVTLAGDKGYDTREFVEQMKELKVTPHVAQNDSGGRRSAVDERTTRHAGYWVSQKRRKLVEEFFGWAKGVAGLRKVKLRGREKVGWLFTLAAAAYNLVRMRNRMAATA
ncbi:MAG: IS5 family transposase [Bryobacteraceae bacterium]|nr:IS5 family transposase [Bryobacteraceae bacterium]